MSSKKPLEIDMIAGSQLRDTQGEMLSVEGADISELEAGRGRFNDNHGAGFYNSIGRITGAKKIFGPEDCTDPRHTYYWEKVKAPFIYVRGRLYDDEDHPNARAASAIMRNIHKSDCPLKIKASVEGGVVARGVKDPSLLARTKIHSVALTFTPANNATLCEPLGLQKSGNEEADMALIKSVVHLAKANVPSFRSVTRNAQAEKIYNNFLRMQEMAAELGLKTELVLPGSPEELIKSAIEQKIESNINKINELVKALKASTSYHIHKDGYRVTDKPVTLDHVDRVYGGVKKLESSGHKLVPAKEEKVNKALTAGYGGAGAPTGHTGGTVLQAEGLDDGRGSKAVSGLKYFTCKHCGHEQVYMKYQCKCRECNKSASLEDLYALMVG